MPIEPQYANVVAFFGGNAFARLESTLRYYSAVLDDQDWQRFLFVLATPAGKRESDLSADLPDMIRRRCHMGSGDPGSIVYQQTVNEISRMFTGGQLNLHLICDDFETACFPPEAPIDLISILHRHTQGLPIATYCYCMLRPMDQEPMQRQRQLAQRILRAQGETGWPIHPYLISRKRDDGTLTDADHLWRALMCEILVVSSGRRQFLNSDTISSLGYTSLNANEMELTLLRRHKLAHRFEEACAKPYTPGQAWQDLLSSGAAPLDGLSQKAAMDAVHNWLLERIAQDLPNPSPEQKRNFRTLCGVNEMASADALLRLAERMIELNMGKRSADTASAQTPQMVSAQRHLDKLLGELAQRPNLCSFPMETLEQMTDALLSLYRGQGTRPPQSPVYPKAPVLPIAKMRRTYMEQCCELAMEAARGNVCERLVPAYARAYGQMFTHLGGLIKGAGEIHDQIRRAMLPSNRFHDLCGKYPKYADAVDSALNQLSASQFDSARLYDAKNALRPAYLSAALDKADGALRNRMGYKLTASFIDAIKDMFNTQELMGSFLGSYLGNPRRLFYNPVVPTGMADTRYFCNANLQDSAWYASNRARVFLVNNDNVERLDYFALTGGQRYGGLNDYLAAENAVDPNNMYFQQRETHGGGGHLPTRPDGALDDAPAANAQAEQAGDAAAHAQGEKAQALRLNQMGHDRILTWDCIGEFYKVEINGKVEVVSRPKYHSKNGMDVTALLAPGKNHIRLLKMDGALLAEDDFCGPPKAIAYRRTADALYVANNPEGISSVVVRETTAQAVGGGGTSFFYYPLYAPGTKRGHDAVCRYEGLSFGGKWELVCDPSDPFCKYEPKHDANL